jgi:SAM-dependent methyltransferase
MLDHIPRQGSLLDIGCSGGTFLSLIPSSSCADQLGIDIAKAQVEYADNQYGTNFRKFRHLLNLEPLVMENKFFSCITLIEVIEHLEAQQIKDLFSKISRLQKPGATLLLSTPNYFSLWPVIEFFVNVLSKVKYSDQHITRLNYFSVLNRLREIYPDLLEEYRVEFKTTTHFIAPFLAVFSYRFGHRLARALKHESWNFPFGNLVLLKLVRQDQAVEIKIAG